MFVNLSQRDIRLFPLETTFSKAGNVDKSAPAGTQSQTDIYASTTKTVRLYHSRPTERT